MGLQQFEERLERLVEGTLAKPFRSNLQPIEIGRKMTREMDLHRRVGVHGLIAPNVFSVTLASADVDRFANFIDALSRELADAAREHARIESYTFVGPVDVQIFEGTKLRAGRFSITAEVVEGPDDVAFAELVLPEGERIPIGADPVVIGRLPECAVVLGDPNVSRRHAELRRVGDSVVVTDLGSTNGTRVNGVTVREQHLASGDEISVGSTTLVFELS
ncbi:MAG: FhaA domain-containing protein [Acidimicrobiales bacterium]